MENSTLSADLDFTSQVNNHLLDFGVGGQYNTLRFFALAPVGVAIDNDKYSYAYRAALQQPFYFGYDLTGKNKASNDEKRRFNNENPIDTADYDVAVAPRNPVIRLFLCTR